MGRRLWIKGKTKSALFHRAHNFKCSSSRFAGKIRFLHQDRQLLGLDQRAHSDIMAGLRHSGRSPKRFADAEWALNYLRPSAGFEILSEQLSVQSYRLLRSALARIVLLALLKAWPIMFKPRSVIQFPFTGWHSARREASLSGHRPMQFTLRRN